MTIPAPAGRRTARLLVALLLAAVGLLVVAAPAGAHADLESSSPAGGATVAAGPTNIILNFTESVSMRDDGLELLDGARRPVEVGPPTNPGGDDKVVRVAVPELGDGVYTVVWRATSGDSHPIRGAFLFSVGDAQLSGSQAELLLAGAAASGGGDPGVGAALGVARFGVFVGLGLLLGAVWFLWVLWPAGRRTPGAALVLRASLWLTALSTALGFLLQGPYTSGGGFGDVFSGDQISAVWDTRFGKVAVLRLLLVGLAAILVTTLRHTDGRMPRDWVAMASVVGVALAATPGLSGHPSSGRWSTAAIVMDVFHVLAMAIWIGGLVMLVLSRRDHETRWDGIDATWISRSADRVAERFSGMALASVVVLVVTGSFQAVRQLEPFSALWDSNYGRLLIAKLVAFAILIALATWSRRMVHGPGLGLVPAGATRDESGAVALGPTDVAGDGGVPPDGDSPAPDPGLGRTVRLEIVVAAVVLAVTSMLVNTSPPEPVDRPVEFNRVLDAGDVQLDTFFGPAAAGGVPNALHVTVETNSLEHADAREVRASLSMSSAGIDRIPIELVAGDHGHFSAEDIVVPFAGDWTLEINALLTEVDQASASVVIPIR